MPAFLCVSCKTANASMKRPKNGDALCRPCFFRAVEDDCHRTIIENNIFTPGEVVASGASGGKDSTVLMHLLKLLNERHNYGIKLHLVSVDEGITGYRDESLVTVRRNSTFYDLPLTIVSYEDLYNGWSMDKIVAKIGNKSNCTYCGVFRRHALEKGARMVGATKIATGHNADDTSETVLMNMLRSDMPRLERCTKATTNEVADDDSPLADNDQSDMAKASIPRVKPLRDLYEKEIVLYAHFQNLDYFSTECTYSKEAFRGNARTLLKQLEAISPRCIANIITSGEEMFIKSNNNNNNKKNTSGGGDERQQQQQQDQESANRVATLMMDDSSTTQSCSTSTAGTKCCGGGTCSSSSSGDQKQQLSKANLDSLVAATATTSSKNNKNNKSKQFDTMSVKSFAQMTTVGGMSVSAATMANLPSQVAQKCKRCGSLSSRPLCRACVLVESLNGTGPKIAIGSDSSTGVGGCGRSS